MKRNMRTFFLPNLTKSTVKIYLPMLDLHSSQNLILFKKKSAR